MTSGRFLRRRSRSPRSAVFFLSLGLFIGWLSAPDFLRRYEKSVAGSLSTPPMRSTSGSGLLGSHEGARAPLESRPASTRELARKPDATRIAGGEDEASVFPELDDEDDEDEEPATIHRGSAIRMERVAASRELERFALASAATRGWLAPFFEVGEAPFLTQQALFPAGFSPGGGRAEGPAQVAFPRATGSSPRSPGPQTPPTSSSGDITPPGGAGDGSGDDGSGDDGSDTTPAEDGSSLLDDLLPGIEASIFAPERLIACFDDGADPAAIDRLLASHGASVTEELPLIGCAVVSAPSSEALAALASDLVTSGLVDRAQPDVLYQPAEGALDALYPFQWPLERIGAPQAWNRMMPRDRAAVAVLDTGFDVLHPDLGPVVSRTINVVAGGTDVGGNADHGTKVAGALAALGDNGYGIAGVNKGWASLVLVKVFGAGPLADSASVIAGIGAALQSGARVINLSLSARAPGQIDPALCQAIANAPSALFVAAAGNFGSDQKVYPAACGASNLIAVASTDSGDGLGGDSSYGGWVHIAAPGESILTTAPSSLFAFASGTSLAAPHVAAVASMVFARDPNRETPASVRSRVLGGADAISGLPVANGRRLSACGTLGGC